jgi:hypothetical protein
MQEIRSYAWVPSVLAGAMAGFFGGFAYLLVVIGRALLQGGIIVEEFILYASFLLEERAFFMPVQAAAVGLVQHFVVAVVWGVVFGLLIMVVMNRVGELDEPQVALLGVFFGLGVWCFNFYVVLAWLYPLIPQAQPWFWAGLEHMFYGAFLGTFPTLRAAMMASIRENVTEG